MQVPDPARIQKSPYTSLPGVSIFKVVQSSPNGRPRWLVPPAGTMYQTLTPSWYITYSRRSQLGVDQLYVEFVSQHVSPFGDDRYTYI
ncbi:hypothetical protein ONS96_008285 [Cadophora gregata f. sp. sojae]|nr:hypothetical protein ONS96_008285 [Cadophora gregata f. sp. sojae]